MKQLIAALCVAVAVKCSGQMLMPTNATPTNVFALTNNLQFVTNDYRFSIRRITNATDYERRQIVHALIQNGDVCRVAGHQWVSKPFSLAVSLPEYPERRACRLCGVTQLKEWK